MGKKSASMKISKNNNNNNNKSEKNKKDFNSLLSVLRPKVYITDSSSFKSLVQELTGNGSSSSSSQSSSPIFISSSSPSMAEPQVVVEPESSTDVTIDTSIDDDSSADQHYLYSSQVLLKSTMTDQDHHHHHRNDDRVVCDQIWLDNTSLQDLMANQQDIPDQVEDLLAYGSLESWLSDIDHHPYSYSFCNNGFVQGEQEVSIYDYELSGLL